MNRKVLNIVIFKGRLILASIFILSAAASCLRNPSEKAFRNLIPEKDFVSILNDLHMTNGLLALPSMRTKHMEQDTSGLYVEIIESYGYRTGQMDTTIQYYYIRKPKKLIRIYDQMLGKLIEIEARLDQRPLILPETAYNQWKGSTSYFIPGKGGEEKSCFEITLTSPGTFTLDFTVTVYPDDQTYNPEFKAWLSHADSLKTGRRNYLVPIEYLKDGNPHHYTIHGTHTAKENVVLKGCFYHFTSNTAGGEPNALIENVTFYYSGTVK